MDAGAVAPAVPWTVSAAGRVNTELVAGLVMATVGGVPGGLAKPLKLRTNGLSISPSSSESSLAIERIAVCGPPLAELNVIVRLVDALVAIVLMDVGLTEKAPGGEMVMPLIVRLVDPEFLRVMSRETL